MILLFISVVYLFLSYVTGLFLYEECAGRYANAGIPALVGAYLVYLILILS